MTLINFIIIIVIIILVVMLLFGNKTERIAKETQKLITDDWRQKGISVTVVEDMTVTKKSGNEYSGMMKIIYEGKTIQLTGTVIYDGKTIQWQPDSQNLIYQLLF